MRAASYVCADDRDRQLEAIRRFVERRGWELVGVYAEPSGGRTKRMGFRQLLTAAEQGKVDVVVIARFDCVAGSHRELARVFDDVRKCHVALAFVEEQIDTSADGGDLVFHVMGAVGELDRRLLWTCPGFVDGFGLSGSRHP